MEKLMNVDTDNLEFQITEVFKRQRPIGSSFLLEKGYYIYTYRFKQITPFGDDITFDIKVEDEKDNNKKYLKEKCIEIYKETVLSNRSGLKVGDVI